MSLKKSYQERVDQFAEQAKELESRYLRFSFIRLITFFIGIGLFIFLVGIKWYFGALFLTVFLLGFGFFIRWHLKIKAAQVHHEHLRQVNQHEVQASEYDFSVFAHGGELLDPQHPFALDMDILGEHSFYQFANRTSTSIGQKKLAEYLLQGTTRHQIPRRQEALKELAPKIEWRQHFQAYGMATEDSERHLEAMKLWLEKAPFVSNKKWIQVMMYLSPIWFIIFFYITWHYLPWQAGIITILPQIWLMRKTLSQVNETHSSTSNADKILAYYARLIQHIEGESFASPLLKELQGLLQQEGKSASARVSRLSYLISQLNVRMNFFAIFLNLFGLWDLHWVWRLEKWKLANKAQLPQWFKCLEEFEALISLATVHYNFPDWAFPKINDSDELSATALGHPLLPSAKRINNDFDMPTQAHTKLITGSNMAGKSTFLRTVGLNIVLAMAGAPVCAKALRLSPLQIYTSMRTQDALHESTSSFYAELKRLKIIIEAIESGKAGHADQRQPFFILDEILKGTNSNDRHTGSKALIRQLIESKGAGLIATHDLELGQLEAQYGGAIENLCMEVEVENDELVFDYKLKKGVSQSFNATHLMRNMGIRV